MPPDLFDDVSRRPSSVRSGRRAVVLISIGAHATVFIGALFVSLLTPGLLPATRTALAFVDNQRVRLMDIELPAPTRPPASAATSASLSVVPPASINAAPVVAPTGVPPETGREADPSPARPFDFRGVESTPVPGVIDLGGPTEKPTALPPQAPVRLHSGIRAPIKLTHVNPIYPALAQTARVQGVVILEAVIDTTGRVESVQVLRSMALLDGAAVDAVRQWRYTPATVNGSPVSVIMTITVTFKL